MKTYISGQLAIEIAWDGVTHDGRDRVKGAIVLPDGTRWEFSDLNSGCQGAGSLLEMAASAISFGSYYSTHNRGDDAPDWAPPGDVASEIGDLADITPDPIPPGFPDKGETDDDETIYCGDLYTVFDSKESQALWYGMIK
jgi:hypothetical protein